MGEDCPVNVGDELKMDYNGPGYNPVFTVENIENDYVITLSNGGRIYPRDIERGKFTVVN